MIPLTLQEKKVFLFVVCAILIGIGADYLHKHASWPLVFDQARLQQLFSYKVNINCAPYTELVTIPNIGRTLAKAIVNYRQENGPFSCIEDIQRVQGIKQKRFQQIKRYISIE